MQEEEIYYDLKKVANILGITYTQVYKYVNTCKNCKKIRKEQQFPFLHEVCGCKKYEPYLQSIDVGSGGQRIRHRVSSIELAKFKRSRLVGSK